MTNFVTNALAKFCILFGVFGLSFVCITPDVGARTQQTLGSAPDVYRVEVKNLNRFVVLEAGDTDGVGELYELRVSLEGGDVTNRQSHDYTERAGQSRRLVNRSTNDTGNNTYLNITVGDHITFGGHLRNRDLWIHSKRVNSNDYTNPIQLRVRATELDCAGSRVCNRRSVGEVSVSFTIPDFRTPPSNICGPDNSFDLVLIDEELAIPGLDNVEVNSHATGDTRVLQVLTQHKTGGPRLRPSSANICIASTVRPGSQATRAPEMQFLRNKASSLCLGLPEQSGGPEVAAVVKNCSFANTVGNNAPGKWIFTPVGYNVFTIRSSTADKCLNLKSSVDNREGGPVKLVGCSRHDDQKWELLSSYGQGDKLQFKNVSSGKCLNVHGREHRDNGRISVYTCADTPDQIWSRIDEREANDIAPLHRRSR